MPTPKAQVIKLSEKEQQALEKLVSKHQTGQQMALRARIILAASSGQTNTAIAQKYAVKHDTVKLWRNRWVKLQDLSLDDLSVEQRLADAPRPGAPSRITTDQRCRIEALACEKPEKAGRPISQWTAREIADEVMERKIVTKISGRHAARLLKIR
ncbi:MAG TPA: helix-turn-helix domain-containing protein [Anaerolineales bacterium]|jgi:putative transposase